MKVVPEFPARLGFAVVMLSALVVPVVGFASAVTTLVNVEVGLGMLMERLSVVKTTEVVALGKGAEVVLRA